MMYGGVAATYCLWKMEGEPFKEGNGWYVRMIHPLTKLPKKVRWYTDKAHAANMPQKPVAFQGKCFGFADGSDYILCIRDRDLSEAEVQDKFHRNWTRGGKWKYGNFFGGVWYAPKDAAIPEIRRSDRVFRATWPEFVAEGRKMNRQLNGADKGYWFEVVIK